MLKWSGFGKPSNMMVGWVVPGTVGTYLTYALVRTGTLSAGSSAQNKHNGTYHIKHLKHQVAAANHGGDGADTSRRPATTRAAPRGTGTAGAATSHRRPPGRPTWMRPATATTTTATRYRYQVRYHSNYGVNAHM